MKKHKGRKAILIIQILCFIYLTVFAYYNHKAFEVHPSYSDLINSDSALYHAWSILWGFSFIPGVLVFIMGLPVFIACIIGLVKFFKNRQDKRILFYSLSSMLMEILLLPVWGIWLSTHQV